VSDDFDPEDIAAMRKQGDLREFLRRQMRPRAETQRAQAPRPPGHRPGAWPTGTSPPSPRPPQPPGAWEDAVARYRAGLGSDNDPCECGACPPPDKSNDLEETP
jgi:hypothetical protein